MIFIEQGSCHEKSSPDIYMRKVLLSKRLLSMSLKISISYRKKMTL